MMQHLLCIGALKGAWGACKRRLFNRFFFWHLNRPKRNRYRKKWYREKVRPQDKLELLRCQKKRLLKRRLLQAPQAPFKAPIHSKCCIGGFSETGLALVIVLRCDWPLCDIWFKSYEHFKINMFLSVHVQQDLGEFFSQNLQLTSLPAAGVKLLNLKSMPC